MVGEEEGGSGERCTGLKAVDSLAQAARGPGVAWQRSQQCLAACCRVDAVLTGEAEADGWARRRTMPFFNYSKIFKLIQIRVMQIWLSGATKFSNKIWACRY
jgi:hypothetical protein